MKNNQHAYKQHFSTKLHTRPNAMITWEKRTRRKEEHRFLEEKSKILNITGTHAGHIDFCRRESLSIFNFFIIIQNIFVSSLQGDVFLVTLTPSMSIKKEWTIAIGHTKTKQCLVDDATVWFSIFWDQMPLNQVVNNSLKKSRNWLNMTIFIFAGSFLSYVPKNRSSKLN